MPVKRERMKRGRCPCECQIALECWGRGLSSLHRSTPHFLPSSFCLSLFFLFSLCLTHTFFHFLILFQSPLAHCSPSLSFFFLPIFFCHLPSVYLFSILAPLFSHHSFFSLPILPIGSPSLYSQFVSLSLYMPSLHSDSNVSLSSMYPFSILVSLFFFSLSSVSLPQSVSFSSMYLLSILTLSLIFLSSVDPFSILAPPPFILNLSIFLYIQPVSILTPLSLLSSTCPFSILAPSCPFRLSFSFSDSFFWVWQTGLSHSRG